MDSKPVKLKRQRIKKTRVRKTKVKAPGIITLKLAGIFGTVYLENYRQINAGIWLFIIIFAGIVSLLVMGSPIFNLNTPKILNKRGDL